MTIEQMAQELQALKAENERLKTNKSSAGNGLKVSEKGAISVYGLGAWPVTLYREQMLKLLSKSDEIKAFITANDHLLATKVAKKAA